jgi:hypothetical protein
VIFRRKQPAGPPVPVGKRWQQLHDSDGEILLHSFGQAEREAVALDPGAVTDGDRSNYLQALPPWLLARAPGLDADVGPQAESALAHVAHLQGEDELLAAVDRLEELGFVRPGPPAGPIGRMPIEFPGLAVAEGGQVRRVAVTGDLGLICRMRGQPLFIAEVYAAAQPARPDPAPDSWHLLARVYVPYDFPATLIERPAGADGGLPPHVLAVEPKMALALMNWLGADTAAFQAAWAERKTAGEAAAEPASQPPPLPVRTTDVASRFRAVAQLRTMQPDGERVRIRFLVVAAGSSADGLYLLDGDLLESATPISVLGLGDRVDDMLKTASAVGGPERGPAGQGQ